MQLAHLINFAQFLLQSALNCTVIPTIDKSFEINPIASSTDNRGKPGAKFRDRVKIFHANETRPTQRGCVYCDATDHRAVNCNKFMTVGDHRKQLGLKQLCFNCTIDYNQHGKKRSGVSHGHS